MTLPLLWVDSLFARISVRYGAAWTRMWEGIDINAVKADWAQELAPLVDHPESIGYALDHLPPDRPPTVTQFRALCIARPEAASLQLPAPKADPTVVAACMSGFSWQARDPKQWAHDLRKRELACERLSAAQRTMWRAALEPKLDQVIE